jgi:hypothetical protein
LHNKGLSKGAKDPCPYHPEYSAVAEHAINQDHKIHFKNMMVLAEEPYYANQSNEISLHYNFSREVTSSAWPGNPSSIF